MANLDITFYDTGGIVIGNPEYQDELLKFAGADTVIAGTILARDHADNTMVPCDPAESDGTEIGIAVLTIEAANTIAGNVTVRPLMQGKVRSEKLLFHNGAVVTVPVLDMLRAFGIIPITVDELNQLDNF